VQEELKEGREKKWEQLQEYKSRTFVVFFFFCLGVLSPGLLCTRFVVLKRDPKKDIKCLLTAKIPTCTSLVHDFLPHTIPNANFKLSRLSALN
jgi:hypothetical protein